MAKVEPGRLYLIPTPIWEEGISDIPVSVIEVVHRLKYFIVERARTARRFVSLTKPPVAIGELEFVDIPESDISSKEIYDLMKPVLSGQDIGLMSEAGLPAVADPGSQFVAYAQTHGIEVVALSGPSSLMMALMGSGMDGQRFAFHGYLSAKREEVGKQLVDLATRAQRDHFTQLFIEAPYRNQQILDSAGRHLPELTLFCIASNVGHPEGFIRTKTIGDWKKNGWPDIHKIPTVFLIGRTPAK